MWFFCTKGDLHRHMDYAHCRYRSFEEKLDDQNRELNSLRMTINGLCNFVAELKQERHDARVRAEYANELLDDTRRVETEQEIITALHDKMKGKR